MCFYKGVNLSFFHSFSENSQEEKPWYYVNEEPAGILFALNCCGILCLSGYLAVTIFCHPDSLYLDKAMYMTLWLTCLFVLGIWFQNIIWIAGFKFHGPKFKMRWRKVLSTHRWIVYDISTYLHFFFERFQFHIKNTPALAAIISERFNYSVTDTCTIMLKQIHIYIYTVLPKFNFKHQGMFF